MTKKKDYMKPAKETLGIVTSNVVGVTGMRIVSDIGGTMGGTTGAIAGTHIPTTMGLGLLAGTGKHAIKQAKKKKR